MKVIFQSYKMCKMENQAKKEKFFGFQKKGNKLGKLSFDFEFCEEKNIEKTLQFEGLFQKAIEKKKKNDETPKKMLFEENRTFKKRVERSDQFQYILHFSMIEKNWKR